VRVFVSVGIQQGVRRLLVQSSSAAVQRGGGDCAANWHAVRGALRNLEAAQDGVQREAHQDGAIQRGTRPGRHSGGESDTCLFLSVPTLFISIHDALFSTLSLGIHVQLPSSPYMVLNRLSIVCACFLTFSLL